MTRELPGRRGLSAAILGTLAACSSGPLPLPSADPGAPATAPAAAAEPAPPFSHPPTEPLLRLRSRWLPVDWSELPGWQSDRATELWPALQRGCTRPAPGWTALCAASSGVGNDEAQIRQWLQQHLQPYRVVGLDGSGDGLVTGYFEPLIEARRQPDVLYRIPIYAPPADLATRRPYWTRQQLDSLPAARASLRGREIAYAADPLEVLVVQIQGSGRLAITEPDGTRKLARLAYAGHNEQPYKSVGRWLIDQGELRPDQASWPAIKSWARLNPERVNELLWSNPRMVFFREEPLPDPQLGPRGAQAVPLTPGRSIAVDPLSIPYGTPVWLDTTEPLTDTPLRRAVMAQDTGSAIVGAVRADYFWGWGDEAEAQAGRMKQGLRLWALWPKTAIP